MKDTCIRFIAAHPPFSLITVIPLVESDAVVNEHNPGVGLILPGKALCT
jgi:hypothetical protein